MNAFLSAMSCFKCCNLRCRLFGQFKKVLWSHLGQIYTPVSSISSASKFNSVYAILLGYLPLVLI